MAPRPKITILVVEDDDDEYELMKIAFEEARLLHCLVRAKDGEDALRYLRGEPCEVEDARPYNKEWPCVMLLDLNLPRKDGRQTLREVKRDPAIMKTPVIVLTNSRGEEDLVKSYELGANSFIRKPLAFSEFLKVVMALKLYWVDIVSLPAPKSPERASPT